MELYRLRAFPNGKNGGNKAGVVINGDGLSEQEMQKIAHDVGYSETAFVTKSSVADVGVRFFTPEVEVDLCGHATIATFNLLRQKGIVSQGLYTQETQAGILRLDVQEDVVYMEQNQPLFLDVLEPHEISDCFMEEDIVDTRYPIQIVSTAMKEIFVPIKTKELLHQLTPNIEQISILSKKVGVIGIHAFALDHTIDAYGRNFAPIVGIDEESATGTSNGALSCYLFKYVSQKENYVLRQGYSMHQPSEIYTVIEASHNKIQTVWVGGSATLITD